MHCHPAPTAAETGPTVAANRFETAPSTVELIQKVNLTDKPVERGVIQLRLATTANLHLLQHWHQQPHVVAAVGDEWGWETELARNPDWREQLIAELDGLPIGFVQIIDPAREDSQYWGCIAPGHRAIDIWIGDEADLGLGFGTRIMKQAIARGFADPTVTTVLVDPHEGNERARRFYERLGFEYVVRRCCGDDRCFVYRLTRPNARREAPEQRA